MSEHSICAGTTNWCLATSTPPTIFLPVLHNDYSLAVSTGLNVAFDFTIVVTTCICLEVTRTFRMGSAYNERHLSCLFT